MTETATSGTVRLERQGEHVVVLRLDGPPLNALTTQVRDALAAAVAEVEADPSVRVLVLWGGPRVFAAGADIAGLAEMGYEQIVRWNRDLQRCLTRIAELPIPVVAAVNGPALGGGLELALTADYRIAGSSSTLGLPEVTLGIMPGSGGTQRLLRCVSPARAKELMMSGRRLSGQEAAALGIVEEVVADESVLEQALATANRLAAGPRFAVAAIKEAVDGRGDGLALERALIAGLFATEDKGIGMRSFLDNGPGRATFT